MEPPCSAKPVCPAHGYTTAGNQTVSAACLMHLRGLLRRPGQGEQRLCPACSYPILSPSCKGFEGKSLLLFLLCMQPTGTRGTRCSNAQSRQVLVGLRGRKELQHLQLGDEEEEETHVKRLPTTIQHEETNSACVRAEKTCGFLSASVLQGHHFKEELP